MTHTTTAPSTLPQALASQPSPAKAEGHRQARATAEKTSAASVADLVAALREHEAQALEQLRRAEQAALRARQRFD